MSVISAPSRGLTATESVGNLHALNVPVGLSSFGSFRSPKGSMNERGFISSLSVGGVGGPAPSPPSIPDDGVRRRAFVVGVARYSHLCSVAEAALDADAVANRLRYYGYEVEILMNPKSPKLKQNFKDFIDETEEGDNVIVYFAGHSIIYDDTMFLCPRDFSTYSSDPDLVVNLGDVKDLRGWGSGDLKSKSSSGSGSGAGMGAGLGLERDNESKFDGASLTDDSDTSKKEKKRKKRKQKKSPKNKGLKKSIKAKGWNVNHIIRRLLRRRPSLMALVLDACHLDPMLAQIGRVAPLKSAVITPPDGDEELVTGVLIASGSYPEHEENKADRNKRVLNPFTYYSLKQLSSEMDIHQCFKAAKKSLMEAIPSSEPPVILSIGCSGKHV